METNKATSSDLGDKGGPSNSTRGVKRTLSASKVDTDSKDETTLRPTSPSQPAGKLNSPTQTKSSSKLNQVGSDQGNSCTSPVAKNDTDHEDHNDDDDDLEDADMSDAYSESDLPRVVILGNDLSESERTDHSVDRDESLGSYESDDDNMVGLVLNDSERGSEDSSGYMGYENAEDGWNYPEDDSLDLESDEEDDFEDINYRNPKEYLPHDPTPSNPYPKPEWTTLKELHARKCGFASSRHLRKRQSMFWFERYASNSLWMIQRLEVVRTLDQHNGCVNSLSFNSTANLMCSGSDDLDICIWDWQKSSNQLKAEIASGHTSNVFQSVFCNRDTNIVTSSRDGSVRLIDVETRQNEKLMSSSGEIQDLTFISEETFLTCGTNAFVNMIDLRSRDTKRLFTVRSPKTNQACQLHSINSHPLDKHMIAVAGKSPMVFLYDLRRLPRELHDPEIKPICSLGNLENPDVRVTSTAFNSTGDKLLISYNDDDLYVCRTDTCEVIHKYQGHRNRRTYKGCAWFGDNFVLSGSDDGHIYGWDLESEHIVCFLEGESNGIVNCLLVHPTLPMLASSGLASKVQIWEPVADDWPHTMTGIKPQICKNTINRKFARSRYQGRFPVLRRGEDEGDTTSDQEGGGGGGDAGYWRPQ